MNDQDNSFPVQWDNPEDAKSLWLLDEMHSRHQVTPLDFDLRMQPMSIGSGRAHDLYGVPFKTAPKLFNSFSYRKIVLAEIPGEKFSDAMKKVDEELRKTATELGPRWEKDWLPETRAHLSELQAFDLDGASLPDLLRHLVATKSRLERLFEVHFHLLLPVMIALSDFDDAYRDLFPDAKPLDVYDLLAGFPNKTVEANTRLWDLGRAAARTPALRDLILTSELSDLPTALAQSSEGRALWSDIQGYLATYGERNDDLYIDSPTWIDDPTPVLRGLREAVTPPERDLTADLEKVSERREVRLSEVRASLASHPRVVQDEFEALLKAAQIATVLSEDHHFWLDCKITYHTRRLCMEVGERLAARGTIESPSDIFSLTLDELLALDAGAPGASLQALITARRAEAARFVGVKCPPFLGTLIPFPAPDSAFMKAGFKFNGGSMGPPSGDGVLRGMPGSSGKVTGLARVAHSLDEAAMLRPGEILIATTTLPSWTPFFATVAAIVTDSGGVLSHAAVVAREYGIPAVVGVRGATSTIRDGESVEVDGDAGLVRILAS